MFRILLNHPRFKSGSSLRIPGAELISSLQLPATPSPALPSPAIYPATAALVTEEILTDASSSSSMLSEQLWNKAYDNLKESDSKIVDAYERVLSQELIEDDSDHSLSFPNNQIEQADTAKRWSQMERLVKARLKKTEREDKYKQATGEVIQGFLSVKDAISLAVQAVPQAALAWTGVCFALQVDLLLTDMLRSILMSEVVFKSYNRE